MTSRQPPLVLKAAFMATAAGLLAAAGAASAQEAGPGAPDRILTDPLYLPLHGQLSGVTGYTYDWSNPREVDATGAATTDIDRHTHQIQQSFSYGVTDDLSVDAGASYVPQDRRRITDLATGDVTERSSSGFTDPHFGVTWRALDQRRSPLDIDLFANYAPDIVDSESARPSDDGSVASGGSRTTFGMELGKVRPGYTIAAIAHATYFGRADEDLATPGFKDVTQGHWGYGVGLESQLRFADRWSVNADAIYDWVDSTTAYNEAAALGRVLDSHHGVDLRTAVNYQLVPGRLAAGLTYDHDFLGRRDIAFPDVPADDFSDTHRSENVVGARLNYAF